MADNASGPSAALNFIVDATPPAAPSGLADAAIVGGYVDQANDTSAQTLTGSAAPVGMVTVYGIYAAGIKAGRQWRMRRQGRGATTSASIPANGNYTLTAMVTDAGGNASGPSAALNFIYATPPAAPSVASGTYTSSAWTLIGTAGANSTITVSDGSTRLGTAAADVLGAWTFGTSAERDVRLISLQNGGYGCSGQR